MAEVDAGQVVASPDTFASYVERWLAEHRPRIEEGTYRDYRVHVERRLKPFFGDLKLGDIAPAHVRRYVAELVETAPGSGPRRGRGRRVPRGGRPASATSPSVSAHALSATPGRARHLLERLERGGLVASAGEPHSPRRRGRSERLYRAVGRRADGRAAGEPGRRIGAKTINNSLIPLRVALGHAVEDGLIARNPAASAPGARQRIKVAAEQPGIDFLRLSEIPRCTAGRPLAEVLITVAGGSPRHSS